MTEHIADGQERFTLHCKLLSLNIKLFIMVKNENKIIEGSKENVKLTKLSKLL